MHIADDKPTFAQCFDTVLQIACGLRIVCIALRQPLNHPFAISIGLQLSNVVSCGGAPREQIKRYVQHQAGAPASQTNGSDLMNDLILYTTDDGRSQIKLRTKDQTVWLSQRDMAQLFDVSTDNVGLHLKNIFTEGELGEKSVTEESSVTAADGKNYLTKLYSLDAILAVGYRVRSPRGVQFRRWAQIITSNGFPLLDHAGSISR